MTLKYYPTVIDALREHTMVTDEKHATALRRTIEKKNPTATHVILFVNLDFSSSQMGRWTLVACGPDQFIGTPEEAEGHHLNDLPSQRQYAVAYVPINTGGIAS